MDISHSDLSAAMVGSPFKQGLQGVVGGRLGAVEQLPYPPTPWYERKIHTSVGANSWSSLRVNDLFTPRLAHILGCLGVYLTPAPVTGTPCVMCASTMGTSVNAAVW